MYVYLGILGFLKFSGSMMEMQTPTHVLKLIKTAQKMHGLRHENYQRYRFYLKNFYAYAAIYCHKNSLMTHGYFQHFYL